MRSRNLCDIANYGFLNNYRVSIIQVKIVSSLPVSAFGHIDNLMMNCLRIDENGSFIYKGALVVATEKKKEVKKWLFSHFSRFITTVALPQLVGTGSFEEPGLGWILHRLAPGLVYQPLLRQCFVDGGLARGNQEKAFEHVGDAPGAILRVRFLDVDDTMLDLWFNGRRSAWPGLRCQPFDPAPPIGVGPAPDRVLADAELRADQCSAVALLQEELDDPEAELDGVGPRPGTFPISSGFPFFLFLFHRVISFLCNWFLHPGLSPYFFNLDVPLTGD
ncbi:hypothetical protein [Desulfosarcina widdelii]|uniref:hypothetical protein n=1 Tax=Desulfosarcina widdelii TaxID=947919 RepID=UPI001E5D6D76|nr:hypothetical protein [Desulfosarcina widdelii]